MKKFKILSLALIFAAFVFNACEDSSTDPIDDPIVAPNAPTNMMASSKSATSVNLKWTASTSESSDDFCCYVLNVTGGATVAPIEVTKGQTTYTVQGLEEGTVYTFSLKAKNTDGSLSAAATINWSPASRFEENENGDPIKIYESASDFGSGLVVYDKDSKLPRSAKVSDGKYWTLGLYTKDNQILLGSPTLLSYSYGSAPSVTEIADVITGITSLDDIYDSQALTSKTFSAKTIDLTNYNSNIAFVIRYKLEGNTEYNYAKVLVKYVNGSFLQGTADNRYVEFILSFQTKTGVPYAIVNEKVTNNSVK